MHPTAGLGAISARLITGAALVAGTVLSGSALAIADTVETNGVVPGDNGTVKIHDPETLEEDHRNVPKVCEFQVVAFGFDPGQEVSWEIVTQGGASGSREIVLEDALVLDDEGGGSTEFLDLEDGHYRLNWTFEGQHSSDAKHKVFKVVCDEEEEESDPAPEPTVEPSDEASTPPEEGEENPDEVTDPLVDGDTDSSTEETDVTDETEADGTEADEAQAPASGSDEGSSDLAVTGSALAGLVAAGAVAVAGGGAAVYFSRRRKAGASLED